MKPVRFVIAEVCRKWDTTLEDIQRDTGTAKPMILYLPRAELCYRLRKEGELSYNDIARRMCRDRSTVINAVRMWPLHQEKRASIIDSMELTEAELNEVHAQLREEEHIEYRDAEIKAERIKAHQEHCVNVAEDNKVNLPNTKKARKCLGWCGETFQSTHYGDRVCPKCKESDAWKSGGENQEINCGRRVA